MCLCNNHHSNNHEKQYYWQQNKEPGDSSVSVLAHQVQYPSPKQDVEHLNNENHNSARDLARIATNIIHSTIS